MKMSDAYTMVVPDVSGRIRLLKNPTYVGDDYYSGTDISDDCVYHIRANDGFIYEGSAVKLLNSIKDDSLGSKSILLYNLKYKNINALYTYQGFCSMSVDGKLYYAKFNFAKGVRITEDVEVKYFSTTGTYFVSTFTSRCRDARYEKKTPCGESYDRIINALKESPKTTQEIARYTNYEESRISGRLSELYKNGVVKKVGKKMMLDTGKKNTLWDLK